MKIIRGFRDFLKNLEHQIFAFLGKDLYSSVSICVFEWVIVACNFIMANLLWFFYIRQVFGNNGGSYRWYVLHPTVLAVVVTTLHYLWLLLEKPMAKVNRFCIYLFKWVNSIFFCAFYAGYVYFYKSFPTSWILMMGGLLFATIQGEGFYMLGEAVTTIVAFYLLENGFNERYEFRIYSISHRANIGFTTWIFIIFMVYILMFFFQRIRIDRDAKEAYDADKAKSSFLASMSHEIRTPINAVLGMNEMILREDINESVEQYAMNIQAAGQNLMSIVNDILDFSKIESGKMEFVNVDYHVASIINDSYNMVYTRAAGKNLELRVAANPSIPSRLNGDCARIRQCIVNILTNGIKYTKQGYVELRIEYEPLAKNQIMFIASIKDTGVGISREELESLFEPFTRIDEKANHNIEGAGLGLSITKSMIEGMDGTISVESREGIGSCFTIKLPQTISDKKPMGEYNVTAIRRASTMHKDCEKFIAPKAEILVVDDVPMNLDVVKGLLKRTKVKVDTCLSGEETLVRITEKHYDIIFLDHLMPGIDGVETLHKMNVIRHLNRSTPVICLTANAIVGAEEEYKQEGFMDYLSKPVQAAALEDMIMKYLPQEKVETVRFTNSNDINTQAESIVSEDKAMSTMDKLSFLDTKTGMVYFGNNEDLYIETVRMYARDRFDGELQKAFDAEDWTSYQRVAHSIKSSSGMIGASDLFGVAKGQEMAAKEGNVDAIKSGHDKLLNDYRELLEKLKDI